MSSEASLTNSVDPDQTAHVGQGLLFLLDKINLQRKKYILEIITCDSSIYTMDHPDLTVSNFMEKYINLQWAIV